jgi:cell division septum initiation protein DivIVA
MIEWLKSLFTSYKKVKELEKEVEVLNEKISEKQSIKCSINYLTEG